MRGRDPLSIRARKGDLPAVLRAMAEVRLPGVITNRVAAVQAGVPGYQIVGDLDLVVPTDQFRRGLLVERLIDLGAEHAPLVRTNGYSEAVKDPSPAETKVGLWNFDPPPGEDPPFRRFVVPALNESGTLEIDCFHQGGDLRPGHPPKYTFDRLMRSATKVDIGVGTIAFASVLDQIGMVTLSYDYGPERNRVKNVARMQCLAKIVNVEELEHDLHWGLRRVLRAEPPLDPTAERGRSRSDIVDDGPPARILM